MAAKSKPWPKPKLGILRDVELFDAGNADTHKGEDYTDEDLESIVENFKKFSGEGPGPRVNPPCVIGHEEDQAWLKNTGIPAAGWPTNLRKVGRKLVGDLTDLPEDVADAIARGAYRAVSAEIYDNPPAGVPAKGKMLRRVAFLGGELPYLKTLKRLPHPEIKGFSEFDIKAKRVNLRLVRCNRQADGTFLAFSEVAMDREQMISMLAAKGIDKAVLDGLDDNQLSAMSKLAGAGEPNAVMEGKDKGGAVAAFREHCKKFMDAYKGMFGEDMPVEMADDETPEVSEVPEEDEGVSEEDLPEDERPMDEEGGEESEEEPEEFGEGNNTADEVATEEPDKNKKKTVSTLQSDKDGTKYFSEGELEKMISKIVNKAVSKVVPEAISAATGTLVRKFSEQEGDTIDNFLSKMADQGRVAPSELDGSGGVLTLRQQLLSLDNSATIGKFSDSRNGNREVPMTARQAMMEQIRRRPAVFKEKVRVEIGAEVRHFSESDLAVEKVRKFCESEEGRGVLRVTQTDPKEFLKVFEAASPKDRAELMAGYGIS